MTSLKAILGEKLQRAERVAVLAIGSALRADDAAGMLAGEELAGLSAHEGAGARVAVFLGGTAPENLTGEIKRFRPTHLVILDAADMGREPGCIELMEPAALSLNTSVSTHGLPVAMLADYLRRFTGCEVIVIGIQPETRGFGEEPSEKVRGAARELAAAIAAAVGLSGGAET
jgi:hydrogenase 3 maturation protease